MSDPNFGIVIRKIDNEPRPVIAADLSTIGIIGPAPGASASKYPLNTPVHVDSNQLHDLDTDLGTTGYVADAIRGINDQLGETQFAARLVIVRTAEGTSEDPALKVQQTINNIVGSSTGKTGIFSFLKSSSELGFTPRIILAPGYTSQLATSVDTIEQVSGAEGSGYEEGETYQLTFAGGGDNAVQATAHAIGQSDGSLGPAIMDTYGAWYDEDASPPVTCTAPTPSPGVAAQYTVTVAIGANPVCASLTSVLNQLMGMAIVESAGTNQNDDEDWRETFQSERLIPLSGGVKIMDPTTGSIVSRPLAPRMAGILVRRDHEKGAPFHSAANQPIQGIIAPLRNIPFYLTDAANEAQELLGFNIGCVVRGELGNEFAIASGGFVLLSTDTASEDSLWQFYNVRRGRDYIHLGLLRTLRYFLGRYNIIGHTVQAILNTMSLFLRDLQADGHILGGKVNFRADANTPEEIRLGHLAVGFMAEEPPVLTRLTIESARYRTAIDMMVADLASQLNIASA